MAMFHEGNLELQQMFGSGALASKLEELSRTAFSEDDKVFIAGAGFFFLATADAQGRPDCSFKGGPPGFVRVTGSNTLEFPDYDGNGMFKSLGNLKANAHVGLLFIALGETPRRLRVNGRAQLVTDTAAMADFPGAQMLVRLTADIIFPNCPRYIPDLASGTPSIYLPHEDQRAVEPA